MLLGERDSSIAVFVRLYNFRLTYWRTFTKLLVNKNIIFIIFNYILESHIFVAIFVLNIVSDMRKIDYETTVTDKLKDTKMFCKNSLY